MIKKGLHPKIYNTKIYCDTSLILELETTQEILKVDIWAGNHPFYTGSQKFIDLNGQINNFETTCLMIKSSNECPR